MKHLETLESACKVMGYNVADVLPVVDKMPTALAKATIAATTLFILSEAAWKAEGKEIDWNDLDQRRYSALWDMETYDDDNVAARSSRGFSFDVYGCGDVYSAVGSRLVFPSRESLEYVVKQHYQVYRDMMVQD